MKKYFKIFNSSRKYWFFAIITPIIMVGEALMELQIPNQIAKIIDYLNEVGNSFSVNQLLLFGIKLLAFGLASLVLGILGGITSSIGSSGFAANLKNDLFRNIQNFSFNNIDKFHSSSLITRMTTDIHWMQNCFMMTFRLLFRAPVMLIYALIKAFQVNISMMLILAIIVPIITIGIAIIFIKAFPFFEKGIKETDVLNQVVEENIRGIRTVKSFTREKDEIKKFDKVAEKIFNYFNKANKIVNLNGPLMNFAVNIVLVLLCVFGTKLITVGEISTGDLYELITYTTYVLTSLMMTSMIFVMFVIAKPSSERIYEILIEKSTITNKDNPIYEVKDGSIAFSDVTFRYSKEAERPALDGINLEIKSGDVVGVLGTIGSSKTTLISLIPRLYDVDKGSVKVGGVDVRDYDIHTLREAVSVVLQKSVLFSGTIKDNIRWGKEDATDEEIIEVCKIAQADDFIKNFENGYDTFIEQGGTNVSGGQKQRLSIARALIKKPKVLILDDSLSAVDTKTDALIREGLKNYSKETTKIIIAQRYQSVMDADKIIIIDNGKIIATGKHNNLLNTSKEYREIFETQNKTKVVKEEKVYAQKK